MFYCGHVVKFPSNPIHSVSLLFAAPVQNSQPPSSPASQKGKKGVKGKSDPAPPPQPVPRPQSRVEFKNAASRPQPTMPMDLSVETFDDPADILTCPLTKTQISMVISSYDKTIGKH